MNRLEISTRCKRYLKKIKEKPLKVKFKEALNEIESDPFVGEQKKGDLAGVYGYDISYQGTDYEVAYIIDTDEQGNLITIILAGTRENFYDELKRHF